MLDPDGPSIDAMLQAEEVEIRRRREPNLIDLLMRATRPKPPKVWEKGDAPARKIADKEAKRQAWLLKQERADAN